MPHKGHYDPPKIVVVVAGMETVTRSFPVVVRTKERGYHTVLTRAQVMDGSISIRTSERKLLSALSGTDFLPFRRTRVFR